MEELQFSLQCVIESCGGVKGGDLPSESMAVGRSTFLFDERELELLRVSSSFSVPQPTTQSLVQSLGIHYHDLTLITT